MNSIERTLIEGAHKLSFGNRHDIKKSKRVGCYQCIRVFSASAIKVFADEGKTGLCPNCDIDSLVPHLTDRKLLAKMCKRWFVPAGVKKTPAYRKWMREILSP